VGHVRRQAVVWPLCRQHGTSSSLLLARTLELHTAAIKSGIPGPLQSTSIGFLVTQTKLN
jgi:hypothetical protein